MQEVDAERRIRMLRGDDPGSVPSAPLEDTVTDSRPHSDRYRKRRRIAGEDDTDRDIRYAREDAEHTLKNVEVIRRPTSDAPLTDHAGHISLFHADNSHQKPEKNVEAEAEAAKKKKEFEDQYTMRFSNAAGFKQSLENPWYSSASGTDPREPVGKDVWGNEDPMRREREKMRTDANDPLAVMRKGVTQLRKAEHDRKKRNEERQRELDALKSVEEGHKRRRRRESEDALEGFSLDAEPEDRERRHRRHHSHRRRHRSRSKSKSRSRDKHRQQSKRQHSHGVRVRSHDLTSGGKAEESGWVKAPGKRDSMQFTSA
jgi:hypothetical protein